MADCIPNDLLDDGRCFQCSTEQQFWMMALQLLCDIGSGSSGGDVQRVFHFPSDPNGSVVAPDPAIGYGDDGSLWVKTNGVTDNTGWEPLIGAFMPEVSRVADAPVQVVLATNRLDPELVFSSMLNSNFVKTPEPSVMVKKNADSFLKRMGNWFASNVWIWSFILVLALLTDTARAQLPPPFIRNQMDTNAIVRGTNGITIHTTPGLTVISNTGSGGSAALTNANLVLLSWLTNGGAAIKTVSAGTGIILTNQGSNIVIAATAAGGGASGDIVATLVSNEVSIVGATVLTDSAYGAMHIITGTSNYLVTLPAVAGNTRRVIGFRVADAFTNLVTLTNSSLIDASATRVMWSQEAAIILCDGSTYSKVAGKSRPMGCYIFRTNNQTAIVPTVQTLIQCNAVLSDFGGMADIANNRMIIRRPAQYFITPQVIWLNPGADVICYAWSQRNGAENVATFKQSLGVNEFPSPGGTKSFVLNAGDAMTLFGQQNSAGNQSVYGALGDSSATYLSLIEVVAW